MNSWTEELWKVGDEMGMGPWISIYRSVDGPKLRKLTKELKCSKFESLGILCFLWFWGQENASKDGRILDADKDDISHYLLGVGRGCKMNPDDIVDALIDTGWIDEVGDELFIHDWDVWQDQWYKAKDRREADTQRKRQARQKAIEAAQDGQQEHIEGFGSGDPPNPTGEKKPPKKYPEAFEEFWAAYPRQVDKGLAYTKYAARVNGGYTEDQLLTAAKAYAAQCAREGTEKRYIKHASTFLGPSTPFTEFLPNKGIRVVQNEVPDESNPFEEYKQEG